MAGVSRLPLRNSGSVYWSRRAHPQRYRRVWARWRRQSSRSHVSRRVVTAATWSDLVTFTTHTLYFIIDVSMFMFHELPPSHAASTTCAQAFVFCKYQILNYREASLFTTTSILVVCYRLLSNVRSSLSQRFSEVLSLISKSGFGNNWF